MIMRRIFVLISWLFYMHVTVAFATTPQQSYVRNYLPAQGKGSTVVLPTTAPSTISAQQVSLPTTTNSEDVKKFGYLTEEMEVQRAWMYSAILPGWGQVYNAHYWKVPVIYAGLAGFGCGAIYYHREYIKYKRKLLQQTVKKNFNMHNNVSECREGRDICIIFAALWYIVNIFDAYVGADLKTFTLSDDISMQVRPTMLPVTTHHLPTIGLSLSLIFQNENTLNRLWKNGESH